MRDRTATDDIVSGARNRAFQCLICGGERWIFSRPWGVSGVILGENLVCRACSRNLGSSSWIKLNGSGRTFGYGLQAMQAVVRTLKIEAVIAKRRRK